MKTTCYTGGSKSFYLWVEKYPLFDIISSGSQPQEIKNKEVVVIKDNNSLAHSTWNCKYHLVFAPKYRRMEIYGKIRKDIGAIIRRLCEQKGVEIMSRPHSYVSKYTTEI